MTNRVNVYVAFCAVSHSKQRAINVTIERIAQSTPKLITLFCNNHLTYTLVTSICMRYKDYVKNKQSRNQLVVFSGIVPLTHFPLEMTDGKGGSLLTFYLKV